MYHILGSSEGKEMRAKAIYLIQIQKDYVELFSESAAGVLDFTDSVSGDSALSKAQAMAHELIDQAEEAEIVFRNQFGKPPVYEAVRTHPRLWRLGGFGAPETDNLAFLYRYPAFRQAQLGGDFIEAGVAVGRSAKLKRLRPLLRHLTGKDLFLVFALYWLWDFDANKEARLAELFGGASLEKAGDIWAELYDFAKPAIDSRNLPSFRAEIKAKLSEYLIDRGGLLALPVVGENFGWAVDEMRQRSAAALAEGRQRALIDGLSGTEDRVRVWLESIRLTLQPEPWNKADPDAMSVFATFPEDDRTNLAGYLRRDIAAYLTPMAREGTIFETKLFHLDEDSLALSLRVARRPV